MDQQQSQIISLIAVFLALGIGILIGASMGEEALVLHQIDFIEELKNEISRYKAEIDVQFLSYMQLQEELSFWESMDEQYFDVLFIEKKLEGININVIAHEIVEKGLIDFLQKSGSSFTTFFIETYGHEEQLLGHDDPQVFIVSGNREILSEAFWEKLEQQEAFVIQIAAKGSTPNGTENDVPFPVIYNIDKLYNKIKLLELIQEYVQG